MRLIERESNGLVYCWCKMLLFHEKNVVRESHNFELAHLKKKKKKKRRRRRRRRRRFCPFGL